MLLNNVSTTDPIRPWPMFLHIAPTQLSLSVCRSRKWPPNLHLLFGVKMYIILVRVITHTTRIKGNDKVISKDVYWRFKCAEGLTFLFDHLSDAEGWWATTGLNCLWSRLNLQGLILLTPTQPCTSQSVYTPVRYQNPSLKNHIHIPFVA